MSKKRPHKEALTARTLALARRRFAEGGATNIDYEHYGEGPEQLFLGDRAPPPLSFVPSTYSPPPVQNSGGDSGSSLLPALGAGAIVGKELYDWYRNSQDPSNNQIGGTGSVADIEAWNDSQLQGMDSPDLALPSWWDNIKSAGSGALGALGLYSGVQQGDTRGYGQALSGAGDVSDALGDFDLPGGSYGDALSGAGNVVSGIDQGGIEGYGQAALGAGEVAGSFGFDQFGNYVPIIGGLLGAYNGAEQGGPGGVASTVGGLYTAANAAGLVAAPAAAGTFAAGSGAAGVLGAFGTVAPIAGLGFAAAELGNHLLGTGREGPNWQAFASGYKDLGITPVKSRVPSIKLPGGQVIRVGSDEGFGEVLRDAYLGGGSEHAKRILAMVPPELRTGKEIDNWWNANREQIDPNYHAARGGFISNEGVMNRRPMGGLSVLNQPAALDSKSYYRYGASPPQQPQVRPRPMPMDPRRMPQFMQPSPLQRAAGGGIGFGYNGGGSAPGELVRGPGSGRSDDIPARLSDGEYIMDSETVALLGDGSTDEGARRLDELRKKLRMDKGKQLSKGKFSSAAKAPEHYLGE